LVEATAYFSAGSMTEETKLKNIDSRTSICGSMRSPWLEVVTGNSRFNFNSLDSPPNINEPNANRPKFQNNKQPLGYTYIGIMYGTVVCGKESDRSSFIYCRQCVNKCDFRFAILSPTVQ
jgi:hypothetical protein